VRISTHGILVAAVLSLVWGVTSAAPQTVDPDKLPKVECSSLRYSKEFLDRFPKAPAACLEARVYKGNTYMKVKGKVYIAGDSTPTVSLMDAYGNTLGTVTVKNPQSIRVIVNGKDVDLAHLRTNEELTIWVPQAMFSSERTASSQ